MACIGIDPIKSLVDEDLDIQVSNVDSYASLTVVSRVEEDNVKYYSYAYFKANHNGNISVKTDEAKPGGLYDGVEPMGLIWSQIQEPGQKPGRRLVKYDVTTPLITHIYVLDGWIAADEVLDLITRGQWLCTTSCERWYLGDGVERSEVREGRLKGTLFIPKGIGPFPGVLDMFGTIGGITEHRAALLASRGIAAFALSYFTPGKDDGLVTDIEYYESAVDYLLMHPKVMKPYAGVIGISKGYELALFLASLTNKVKACVALNGADVVTLATHTYKQETFPVLYLDIDEMEYTDDGVQFLPVYKMITPEQHDKYGIPVERGNCEYLLIHGLDDRSCPPVIAEYVTKRLQKHGKSNYRVILYPGTGHLIEPPHSPHFYKTYHAMFKSVAVWGGNGRQHARAQEHFWKETINFFKTVLFEQNKHSTLTEDHHGHSQNPDYGNVRYRNHPRWREVGHFM